MLFFAYILARGLIFFVNFMLMYSNFECDPQIVHNSCNCLSRCDLLVFYKKLRGLKYFCNFF